jgi:hypothetical protein
MVALPAPEIADVIVIQEGVPVTVHEQAACAVSTIDPVPEPLGSEALAGDNVASAHAFAACVTVKLLPATVKVALRSGPVLAAAVTLSVVLPVPASGIVIQEGLPTTGQEHVAGAVTATVEVPAFTVKVRLAGEIVGAGTHGLADWLTVRLRLAMLRVALRAAAVGFAATEYGMPALPVPPDCIVIHVGEPVTVHTHVEVTLSDAELEPPW